MMDLGTIEGRALLSLILVISGILVMSVAGRVYLLYVRFRTRKQKWPSDVWADGRPALICFSTDDCVVCKFQQRKAVEAIRKRYEERGIDIRKFNATERADLAKMFGVVNVPTTVILDRNGQIAEMNNGLAKEKLLAEQIEKILS